jgi:HAD superfamily hydrolase (TIGR01450 family)
MESLNNYIRSQGKTPSDGLRDRLRNIRHIALDMDGTIYNGSTLFPYTISFLNNLKKLGIGYSFLTNNPSKSINDYLLHLKNMGISSKHGEIYTSALATIDYLLKNYPRVKRLFFLGTPSMIKEFEAAGFESTKDDANDIPDAVVVGFDETLSYQHLCRAAWWISKGLLFLATNPDRVCPTDKPTVLVDCGSICTCLESATGRAPDIVIGKPDPRMLDGIMQRYNLQPSQIAMVGDRIYTDLKMAHDAKTLGVLVLSGETSMEGILLSDLNPDIVVDDIAVFGQMLFNAYKNK